MILYPGACIIALYIFNFRAMLEPDLKKSWAGLQFEGKQVETAGAQIFLKK